MLPPGGPFGNTGVGHFMVAVTGCTGAAAGMVDVWSCTEDLHVNGVAPEASRTSHQTPWNVFWCGFVTEMSSAKSNVLSLGQWVHSGVSVSLPEATPLSILHPPASSRAPRRRSHEPLRRGCRRGRFPACLPLWAISSQSCCPGRSVLGLPGALPDENSQP